MLELVKSGDDMKKTPKLDEGRVYAYTFELETCTATFEKDEEDDDELEFCPPPKANLCPLEEDEPVKYNTFCPLVERLLVPFDDPQVPAITPPVT